MPLSPSLVLTHESVSLDKCVQDHGDWQKVRLMPALLRIFTRVNLLAFIGEDQGMQLSTSLPAKHATDCRCLAAADRLEVCDNVMSFFWSCAKAFPILNLTLGFLLPSVITLNQPMAAFHQAHGLTDSWVP